MWFGVSILSKSCHAQVSADEPVWEESIVVVEANSIEEAEQLGIVIGQGQEVEYTVAGGDSVHWVFDSIGGVFEITAGSIGSGVEVFSRYLKNSEVLSLKKTIE